MVGLPLRLSLADGRLLRIRKLLNYVKKKRSKAPYQHLRDGDKLFLLYIDRVFYYYKPPSTYRSFYLTVATNLISSSIVLQSVFRLAVIIIYINLLYIPNNIRVI